MGDAFEKQPFADSPAAAREYLAQEAGGAAEAIGAEAARVAAIIAGWQEPATLERRARNMEGIKRGIRVAREFLKLMRRYAPRHCEPKHLAAEVEFLIFAWEAILPTPGRPLDAKTEFAVLMLRWATSANVGRLSPDAIRAAAIVGHLEMLATDRMNRETWRKAVKAAVKARERERNRSKRLEEARRRSRS